MTSIFPIVVLAEEIKEELGDKEFSNESQPWVVSTGAKGGPGSGHHGHVGRPGQRGGSASGKGGTAFVHVSGTPPSPDSGIETVGGIDVKADAMLGSGFGKPGELESWSQAGDDEEKVFEVFDEAVQELSDRTDISYGTCSDIMTQWMVSSNDTDMRSLALQKDTAEEFDVSLSDFAKERIKKVEQDYQRYLDDPKSTLLSSEDKQAMEMISNPILPSDQQRRVLREMYNITQEKFAEEGYKPSDKVRLYRGLSLPESISGTWNKGDVITIRGSALESWSVSGYIAKDYSYRATGRPITLAMDIPVSRIISTARIGFGCLTSGEFVIIGGIDDKVQIVSID